MITKVFVASTTMQHQGETVTLVRVFANAAALSRAGEGWKASLDKDGKPFEYEVEGVEGEPKPSS